MPAFTPHELRERMLEAPLRTTELRVCVPIVNRRIAALERGGFGVPPVQLSDKTIVGEAATYVAAFVLGLKPRTDDGASITSGAVRYSFRQVIFDPLDWENMTGSLPYLEPAEVKLPDAKPPEAQPPEAAAKPAKATAKRSRRAASRRRSRSSP